MLFHFRIQLADITKPPVWRKVSVPADFSFEAFHRVIQAAFGWWNAHLFSLRPKVTTPIPSYPAGVGRAVSCSLGRVRMHPDLENASNKPYPFLYHPIRKQDYEL